MRALEAPNARAGALPSAEVRDRYAVVHLVSQEGHKELIGPQVIDPLAAQLAFEAETAPHIAAAALLEAARVALSQAMRAHAAELRARAGGVHVRILPYVSRLTLDFNARWVAPLVARMARGLPLVLHCRGESAAAWARALRRRLPSAGIVLDVRGAWPEELLFARGFDGPAESDISSRALYDAACADLRMAATEADAVITTSEALIDWMHSIGVRRSDIGLVPCCVSRVVFDEGDRRDLRRALGVEDKLVIAYSGTTSSYQHLSDGFVPLVRAATDVSSHVHGLCITPDVYMARALLAAAGVPTDRATVIGVPQPEVGRYLCAADAAVLLRRTSRMNRVARPIKLGEYLSSGSPVIVSRMRGGWECASIIEEANAGIAIDWFDRSQDEQRQAAAMVVSTIHERGTVMRMNALGLCERSFTWSAFMATTRHAYLKALHSSIASRSPP